MKPKIKNAIFVDASCIGNPGKMEYRAIDSDTKKELFHSPLFPIGTNNIGEFLAIVDALKWCKTNTSDKTIYTDSQTALHRIQSKKIKTTLDFNEQTKPLLEKLQESIIRLKTNYFDTKIIKRETEIWGEIPADFGRK